MDEQQTPGPWDRASPEAGGGTLRVQAAPPPGPAAPDPYRTRFEGNRSALFGLALKTSILTVLTLGIYRFWMKTKLRRWYWSATRPGGFPLEYVGEPMEKLLGFLIAVVILAFYIGVVNLILMFLSFSLFRGNAAAYVASFAGLVPLWFYATYRARRYVLARTRWRGMRFGLEPGAWGYTWRALVHWGLTLVTAGLLWPRMTFWLEKYKTDRTFFGDRRLHQGGRWTMLYPAMIPLLVAAGLGAAAAGAIYADLWQLGAIAATFAAFLLVYGLIHYRVETLKRLTATKELDGARLTLRASPARILGIYIVGNIIASFAMAIPLVILGVIIGATGAVSFDFDNPESLTSGASRGLLIVISVVAYFSIFLLWSVLTHVFVTMPVWRHFTDRLSISDPDGDLARVTQRPRDEHREAEGFAEALDVGASL